MMLELQARGCFTDKEMAITDRFLVEVFSTQALSDPVM
jgi:hypothetical protein